MKLPMFQTPDRLFSMLQSQWSAILNPIISNPVTNPRILSNIALVSGVNVINTGLGQLQQGWIIIDKNGNANIYRSQPYNELTLTLTSDAVVTISLMVF